MWLYLSSTLSELAVKHVFFPPIASGAIHVYPFQGLFDFYHIVNNFLTKSPTPRTYINRLSTRCTKPKNTIYKPSHIYI